MQHAQPYDELVRRLVAVDPQKVAEPLPQSLEKERPEQVE